MAFSFPATASTVPPQPSLRCRDAISSGLKLNSASARPSISADVFSKASLSLQRGACKEKPTRGQIQTMCYTPDSSNPEVWYTPEGATRSQLVGLETVFFEERIIFLGEYIDESYSNILLATLLYLDIQNDNKRLHFYITVSGGDVNATLSVYDTMNSLRRSIGTVLLGYAMNLMGFIVAAGEKGKRYAMPHARIAIKSPSNYASGQADDVVIESQELLRLSDYLCKEFSEKTGQPLEKVSRDFKYSKTKDFNANEAVEYGIIDRILKPRPVARLRNRRTVHKYIAGYKFEIPPRISNGSQKLRSRAAKPSASVPDADKKEDS